MPPGSRRFPGYRSPSVAAADLISLVRSTNTYRYQTQLAVLPHTRNLDPHLIETRPNPLPHLTEVIHLLVQRLEVESAKFAALAKTDITTVFRQRALLRQRVVGGVKENDGGLFLDGGNIKLREAVCLLIVVGNRLDRGLHRGLQGLEDRRTAPRELSKLL
jgi:hypothetical protein